MSQTSEMWGRFFAGSKYEAKWLGRGAAASAAPVNRSEEIASFAERLAAERLTSPPPAQETSPFDHPKRRRVA